MLDMPKKAAPRKPREGLIPVPYVGADPKSWLRPRGEPPKREVDPRDMSDVLNQQVAKAAALRRRSR